MTATSLGGFTSWESSDGEQGGNAVIIGEGETALMVTANAKAKVVNCATDAILTQKSCDGLRILVVDATRMP